MIIKENNNNENMQAKIIRSLSIDNIIQAKYVNHPSKIDIIVSVGGFYGFFMIGIDKILKKLQKVNKIHIQRYSGSSVGAICSVLMACNIPGEVVIQIYNNLKFSKNYFAKLRSQLLEILPDNAHEICSDRVFIHMTRYRFPFRFDHVVVSTFMDKMDLVDAMMASSSMPYFINPNVIHKFRNEYFIDGCFSTMLPVFKDNTHHQLLIKLYR
ncbi:MAG: hypothetical protein EBV19_05155, partial [Flavobacteriia bacterium]|nr:hypothetical protein [Flavobacteriia bacterium]